MKITPLSFPLQDEQPDIQSSPLKSQEMCCISSANHRDISQQEEPGNCIKLFALAKLFHK